jgi:hypothetical protein
VAAEYESDLRSERLKLKHAELAAAGQWEGGMRNFGHDLQEYVAQDDHGRPVIKYKLVPNPTEAPALQQAAKDVIDGRTPTAISIQWNKQGLITTTGKKFTPARYASCCEPQDCWAALCRWQARQGGLAWDHHRGRAQGPSGHPGAAAAGADQQRPHHRQGLLVGRVRVLWQ